MKIFESLTDNPSFQRAINEAAPVPEIASSPDVTMISPPPGVASSRVPDKLDPDCGSCPRHDEGWCWDGAKRTWFNIKHLEVCPRTVSASEPERLKYGCDSCNRHHRGWCRAVPGWPFYNIKFLKACPLLKSIPEPERLRLTYQEYQKPWPATELMLDDETHMPEIFFYPDP